MEKNCCDCKWYGTFSCENSGHCDINSKILWKKKRFIRYDMTKNEAIMNLKKIIKTIKEGNSEHIGLYQSEVLEDIINYIINIEEERIKKERELDRVQAMLTVRLTKLYEEQKEEKKDF